MNRTFLSGAALEPINCFHQIASVHDKLGNLGRPQPTTSVRVHSLPARLSRRERGVLRSGGGTSCCGRSSSGSI